MTMEQFAELRSKLAVLGQLARCMKDEAKGDSKEFDDAAELYECAWKDTLDFVDTLADTVTKSLLALFGADDGHMNRAEPHRLVHLSGFPSVSM